MGSNRDAHPNPEIDLALLALQKPIRPEFPPVPLPPAPQAPPLPRNKRIQLFEIEEPGRRNERRSPKQLRSPNQLSRTPNPIAIAHGLGADTTEQGG